MISGNLHDNSVIKYDNWSENHITVIVLCTQMSVPVRLLPCVHSRRWLWWQLRNDVGPSSGTHVKEIWGGNGTGIIFERSNTRKGTCEKVGNEIRVRKG